jgi:hypothetical protein
MKDRIINARCSSGELKVVMTMATSLTTVAQFDAGMERVRKVLSFEKLCEDMTEDQMKEMEARTGKPVKILLSEVMKDVEIQCSKIRVEIKRRETKGN